MTINKKIIAREGLILEDITERKQIYDALEQQKEERQIILDSVPAMVFYKDKENRFIRINKALADATGLPKEKIEGKTAFEVYPGYAEKYWEDDKDVMASGQPKTNIIEPMETTKGTIWVQTDKIPYRDGKGNVIGIIGFAIDITERKIAEEERGILNKKLLKLNKELGQLALRDSHTGLYNHRYLKDALETEFERAKRHAQPLSVMMLDIDYFKSINDVYGHQFGDLVLRQLAAQLKKSFRKYDIIIRYGGEEFIILSPGTDTSAALNLARRLLDTIALHNFGTKKQLIKLKLSIGVSSYPDDNVVKSMDLMELSDKILNKAKESGSNQVYSSIDIKKDKPAVLEKGKEDPDIKLLKGKIDKLTKRAHQSLAEAVYAFAKTIELKDHYTGEHVEDTVRYATEISRALNLPKYEVELISQAAILHDLGKIGISDKILLKKERLTKKEFEEIKKHPRIAVDILRPIQFLHNIIPLVLHHHERWDGKGYPKGLKKEAIPIGARIIALADNYQALISERHYRKAYSKKEAMKIIKKKSGSQFDPDIADVFLSILQKAE